MFDVRGSMFDVMFDVGRWTLLCLILLTGSVVAQPIDSACGLAQGRDGQDKAVKVVTWTKDVAPIVYQNCASCHRTGEVAPFPLLTYGDAKRRSKEMALSVAARTMPVWKPEKNYGEFVGERRLSDDQIATIKAWVDGGCAEGDAKDLPPEPKFGDGWAFGEPDLVVKMAEEYTVPAEGRDIYRNFAIPLNLTEEKYVRAVQFRPGNKKVVHHALMFLDTTGDSRKKDEQDPKPGFGGGGLGLGAVSGGGLGGWAPGGVTQPMPDGIGKQIKKNSDLLLQLHFHPSGKVEKELSQIGIWFCKEKPKKLVSMVPMGNRQLDIAPGDKNYKVEAQFTTPVDVEFVGITPHAHYIAKEMKVWAVTPDKKEIPLVWIKDWDFDWQEQYQFKTPVKIPKGTTVKMIYTYDNSADNPKNPATPPVRVRWGEQTTNEMALTFFSAICENQGDTMKLMAAIAMGFARGK